MQLKLALAAAGLAAGVLGAVQPVQAAVCVLLPLITGQLGPPTSNDTQLSSEDQGGRQATFTVAVVGSSTITVSAPDVVYNGQHPHSGDTPAIKYTATGLLGVKKQQPYTALASTFGISTLDGTVTATVDGKINNSSGFPQGDYTLRTVVTCS